VSTVGDMDATNNTAPLVLSPAKYMSKWKAVESCKSVTQSAVEEGLDLDRQCRGVSEGLFDIDSKDIKNIGGSLRFFDIFIRAYERFFADPHLRVLFNESPECRTAEEHGKLLGSFLLARISFDRTYSEMRVEGYGHGLGGAHARARNCPHRPAEHRGRRFLKSQGYAWLGHVSIAVDEVLADMKDSKKRYAFKLKLMNGLKDAVFEMYSPWVNDDVKAYVRQ